MNNKYKQVSIKINHAGTCHVFIMKNLYQNNLYKSNLYKRTQIVFFCVLEPDINLLLKFLNYKVCWKEDGKEVMFFT